MVYETGAEGVNEAVEPIEEIQTTEAGLSLEGVQKAAMPVLEVEIVDETIDGEPVEQVYRQPGAANTTVVLTLPVSGPGPETTIERPKEAAEVPTPDDADASGPKQETAQPVAGEPVVTGRYKEYERYETPRGTQEDAEDGERYEETGRELEEYYDGRLPKVQLLPVNKMRLVANVQKPGDFKMGEGQGPSSPIDGKNEAELLKEKEQLEKAAAKERAKTANEKEKKTEAAPKKEAEDDENARSTNVETTEGHETNQESTPDASEEAEQASEGGGASATEAAENESEPKPTTSETAEAEAADVEAASQADGAGVEQTTEAHAESGGTSETDQEKTPSTALEKLPVNVVNPQEFTTTTGIEVAPGYTVTEIDAGADGGSESADETMKTKVWNTVTSGIDKMSHGMQRATRRLGGEVVQTIKIHPEIDIVAVLKERDETLRKPVVSHVYVVAPSESTDLAQEGAEATQHTLENKGKVKGLDRSLFRPSGSQEAVQLWRHVLTPAQRAVFDAQLLRNRVAIRQQAMEDRELWAEARAQQSEESEGSTGKHAFEAFVSFVAEFVTFVQVTNDLDEAHRL